MKRAIFVALGTGAVITSAAALGLGTQAIPGQASSAHDEFQRTRIQVAAREAQREIIDSRYREARAECEPLGGLKRDQCFIKAHAARGRALLDQHAPYTRN